MKIFLILITVIASNVAVSNNNNARKGNLDYTNTSNINVPENHKYDLSFLTRSQHYNIHPKTGDTNADISYNKKTLSELLDLISQSPSEDVRQDIYYKFLSAKRQNAFTLSVTLLAYAHDDDYSHWNQANLYYAFSLLYPDNGIVRIGNGSALQPVPAELRNQ